MNKTMLLFHILAAIVLLGTALSALIWKTMAGRTGNPATVAFAHRGVASGNLFLALPGILVLLYTGMSLAADVGGLFSVRYVAGGFHLFMAAIVLWIVQLPLQRKLSRMAREFEADETVPAAFVSLNRWWTIAGVLGTLLMLGSLVYMVLKPGLHA